MKRVLVFLAITLMIMFIGGCEGNFFSAKSGSTKVNDEKDMAITVSVAASLQEAMTEIRHEYAKDNGLKTEQIALNFGGSGTLRQQLEQGAPSAIFISADTKNMNLLEDKHIVESVKPWVSNSLVLVTPKNKTTIDGTKIDFSNLPRLSKVAIGTPETVPAGKYGKEVLAYYHVWNDMEGRLVYGKDVRAVLAYVTQKAVDAGIVYKTDAVKEQDNVTIVSEAPNNTHEEIIYPVGIVAANQNSLSKSFYDYLFGPKAKAILHKYGFTTVNH